jgi:SAM-dependent methyltransferase
LSTSSIRPDYLANYDAIAAKHLAHLDQHGFNPWMSDDLIEELNAATLAPVYRLVPAGARILDAGCGTGILLSQFGAYDRYGCDISRAYLERAKAYGSVRYAAVEAMPYKNGWFAAVVCTDVLEHVLDLNAAVKEILRVLKPGGTLIVRVPSRENLEQYLNNDYRFVHLRLFDGNMLKLMFDRVFGCEVVETVEVRDEVVAVVRKP